MTDPDWTGLPGWTLGPAPTSRGFYPSGERMRVGDLVRVIGNACSCFYEPHTTVRVVDLVHTRHARLSEQWIAAVIIADRHPGGPARHCFHASNLRLLEAAPDERRPDPDPAA